MLPLLGGANINQHGKNLDEITQTNKIKKARKKGREVRGNGKGDTLITPQKRGKDTPLCCYEQSFLCSVSGECSVRLSHCLCHSLLFFVLRAQQEYNHFIALLINLGVDRISGLFPPVSFLFYLAEYQIKFLNY